MAKKSIQEVIANIESTGVFKADFGKEFAYINNKQNLPVTCLAEGHKTEVRLNNILARKIGCPKCSGKYKRSIQEVIEDINSNGKFKPDFDETFAYKNNHQKLPLICLKEGHKSEVPLHSILSLGVGCAKCAGVAKKSIKEVISEIKSTGIFKPDFDENHIFDNCSKPFPVTCIEGCCIVH